MRQQIPHQNKCLIGFASPDPAFRDCSKYLSRAPDVGHQLMISLRG
jgi:hypothetical protein